MTPEEKPQPAIEQKPEEQVTQTSPLPLCMIAGRYCLCQSPSGFELIDIAKLSLLNRVSSRQTHKQATTYADTFCT